MRPGKTTYVWDRRRQCLRPFGAADRGVRDNRDFRSVNAGCAVHQVAEFERDFGPMGVRFDPRTGDAIIPDRATKKRYLKARGMVDYDEVW